MRGFNVPLILFLAAVVSLMFGSFRLAYFLHQKNVRKRNEPAESFRWVSIGFIVLAWVLLLFAYLSVTVWSSGATA